MITGRIQTSDEKVFEVSSKKDKINGLLLDVMKRFAVDCVLNSADNTDVDRCTIVKGNAYEYMFDPDIQKDIIDSISVKDTSVVDIDRDKTQEKNKMKLQVIHYKKVKYVLYPKPGSAKSVFLMYPQDTFQLDAVSSSKAYAEVSINPSTGLLDKGSSITRL
jgi:hypothetical protein